jgi:PAS domain S-box-containing protein
MQDEPAAGARTPVDLRALASTWTFRYGFAAAATAVAFLLRMRFAAYLGPPFITFFPTVLFAAVLGGLGPGLLATAGSAVLVAYRVMPSEGSLPLSARDLVSLGAFTAFGVFLSVMAHLYREARIGIARYEHEAALRQANERLRSTEEDLRRTRDAADLGAAQLAAVFEAMNDGVCAFDMSGQVVLLNEAEARINGFPSAADMKRNLAYFAETYELRDLDGRSVPVEEWPVSRVLRGETVVDWELRGRRRDTGREWFFSFSGGPVRDARGAQALALVITRDVTNQRRARELLGAEKERLAVTLRSIGDAVIATDEAARVTLLNDVAEALTGWKAAEAMGKPLHEVFRIVNEETRRPAANPVERVLREGVVVGLANHTSLIARDGTERPIADSGAPIRDAAGRITGVVLVFRDQTEERRAEESVLRSRRELLELIEKIPLGVFVERGSKVIYANPALAAYLGYSSPAELIGKGPEDVLAPDEREAARGYVHEEGRPYVPRPPREWRFVRRDGRIAILESAASREIEFEGRPAALFVLRDLTDLKRMQAQLMQSDRMASVGMLAAGVAHEINNPLAYLTAALDFLDAELKGAGEALPGDRRAEMLESLSEALEGASRVRHVVRDLKTFSRVEAEHRSRVDLRAIIDSSISMVLNEIKHRARLVKDYRETPPVLANEARLGQVFLNLLINAAQALPEGRADANEIRVVTRTDELGRAVVEVRDSGPGIPPEIMERIFDPFFSTKPVGVGTGLGLSICKNIVKALGGEITAESGPSGGTVFRVTLSPAPQAGESAAPAPPRSTQPGRKGHVLVVDDEPAVGSAIRRALAIEHQVLVLTSAREARDRIARGERFDAIVCDLMMPEMTGMDLHSELTVLCPDQAERMILLTGGAFTARAAEFLDAVPNARIEKPFDVANLRALVRGLVR